MSVVLLTRTTFALCYIVLFVCSVSWLFLLGCQYRCKRLTGKTRLRNDLLCVDGDVKPYSLTHSVSHSFVVSIRICEYESSVNRATDLCKLVSVASQLTGGVITPERHAPTASGWTRGPAAAAFERLPSRSILHSATRPDPRQPGHPPRRRRTGPSRRLRPPYNY